MKTNKILIRSLILALSLYGLNANATTYVYRNFIPGANSSTCTPVKLGSTKVFDYTGNIQEISVPAQAVYAKAFVEGAGESTTCTSYGGQGGTSFAASSVKNLSESLGALGGGPNMSVGQNGYIQITFYGCAS